ncbi:MAG: hypothetical protein P8M80_16560 [Pirellulaceae bacterium]|nr:hypothetical protein [Pirellulaceae bacterium]
MLEFACPRCAQLIEPEENQMGQSMICSGCQSSIKVPGSHGQNSDKTVDQKTWNVFENDEAFFETTEKPSTGVPYRTREDDKEAVVDDDAAALADEEREQQAAVAESLAKAKFESGSLDLGASTPLTSEEKMKEDNAFRKMMKDLPDDSPLKRTGWFRPEQGPEEPLELDNQPQGTYKAVCPICDSVTLVRAEKSGQKIRCSDCGSDVDVPQQVEQPKKEKWQQTIPKEEQVQKKRRQIADELFVEQPDGSDAEYGLAPPEDDLLTPLAPPHFEISPTADGLADTDSPVGDSPSPTSKYQEEPAQNTAHLEAETSELESSRLFEEIKAEGNAGFELKPLREHLFSVLVDPGYLLRLLITTTILFLTLLTYSIASSLEGESFLWSAVSFFLMLPVIFLGPIGVVCQFWLGQQTINATVIGRKLGDLGSPTMLEWFSNSLFVGFSFLVGALPGAFMGVCGFILLRDDVKDYFWLVPACGGLTAMILSPVLMLSAFLNESPFRLISREIIDSFPKHKMVWKEFYVVILVISISAFFVWMLAILNHWLGFAALSLLVTCLYGFYFRMIGRLLGVLGNDIRSKKAAE